MEHSIYVGGLGVAKCCPGSKHCLPHARAVERANLLSASSIEDRTMGVTEDSCSQQRVPMPSF